MSDPADISFTISAVEHVRPARFLNTEEKQSWFVKISHNDGLFKEAQEELLEVFK
jgi:hypothetical protein